MKISELQGDSGARQKRKRVGRGESSNWGRTAGRGNKGQQSRKSGRVRPGFEGGQMPLQRRIPKRGFNNIFRKEVQIVNLKSLEEKFGSGESVEPQTLAEKKLIKKQDTLVKILGVGTLTKKLYVKANAFSKSAIEKITKLGGSYEVI